MAKTDILYYCKFCNKEVLITVDEEDIKKYENGALIQQAFPYLTSDEREIMLSGMCGDCWEKYMESFDKEEIF